MESPNAAIAGEPRHRPSVGRAGDVQDQPRPPTEKLPALASALEALPVDQLDYSDVDEARGLARGLVASRLGVEPVAVHVVSLSKGYPG